MNLDMKEVSVSIDDRKILEKISLDVQKGDFVGLIGPNGSGKSTILRTLYKAIRPTSGHIYFDQEDICMISAMRSAQRLGVMKQNSSFSFDFTVIDLVLMGRSPYKKSFELDNQKDYEIAKKALSLVGLEGYEERFYNTLSGGEQQRVMIARVLTGEPEFLLLDEMTNHLDVYYQYFLLQLIKEQRVEVLAVMHDLNLAAKFCNKLYCIKKGKVVAYGSVEQVLTKNLLASVFEMRGDLIYDSNHQLHILYQGTV